MTELDQLRADNYELRTKVASLQGGIEWAANELLTIENWGHPDSRVIARKIRIGLADLPGMKKRIDPRGETH